MSSYKLSIKTTIADGFKTKIEAWEFAIREGLREDEDNLIIIEKE